MNPEHDLSTIAFEFAPIGLVLTEKRIIRSCNLMFAEMFGYPKAKLVGQSFQILYRNRADFDRVRDVGLTHLAKSADYSDERIMKKSDGTPIWVRFRAHTLTPQDPLLRIAMSFASIPKSDQNPAMTKREREVVTFLAQGKTSKEIARSLSLSPRTIEDVRARLLRKFGVSNTVQLLRHFGGPSF